MHIFLDDDCTYGVEELLSSKEPCILELQPEKPDIINHAV
jgi:hypothetical protein